MSHFKSPVYFSSYLSDVDTNKKNVLGHLYYQVKKLYFDLIGFPITHQWKSPKGSTQFRTYYEDK